MSPPSREEAATPSATLDLLSADILRQVLAHVGPQGTARCAAVCQTWQRVVHHSPALWRQFCHSTFGFSAGDPLADWRRVYAYLTSKAAEPHQLLPDATVVFADDGGGFMFFKAHRAIVPSNDAWCTNSNVSENVDLVVQTKTPALVSGFAVSNPGVGYSAPLHEALVFASYDAIDLDAARAFDGSNGTEWIDRIQSPAKDTTSHSLLHEIFPNIALQDIHSRPIQEHVPHANRILPRHEGLVRTTRHAQANAGETLLKPLAGFRTPPLPRAYNSSITRLVAPTVARHVHFKLLNSYKTPGIVADNIDVLDLLTFGVPLPELTTLAGIPDGTNLPAPDYKPIHPVRPSRSDMTGNWLFE